MAGEDVPHVRLCHHPGARVSGLLAAQRVLLLSGNDGIGAGVAARLADEGARVFHAGPGGNVAWELEPGAVPGVLAAATGALGGVDHVVNAATDWGIADPDDSDAWERLERHNLAAGIAVARAAERAIDAPGSLCSVSHVWSTATSPELALTGASKAGLAAITKAVALRGAPRGLRANLVALGLIDTPALRALAARRAQCTRLPADDAFERQYARTALGRPGTPDEVGKAIAFLLSDHARLVTGATVLVDGGLLWA